MKTAIETNFPIGTDIILISNEPSSHPNGFDHIETGTVVGYSSLNKRGDVKFVVYTNPEGEEKVSFSSPMYFSEELFSSLSKLSWDERWNIYSKGLSIITKDDKSRKELQ